MKSTGIIRKLDGLGRVVIPIEYRKRNDIKFLDPLEITAMDNGDIVLRRVDLTVQLTNAGTPVIEELRAYTCKDIALSSTREFLAGVGKIKDTLSDKRLSDKAQDFIAERKAFCGKSSEIGLKGAEYVAFCPVYSESIFGAVIMFNDAPISESENKMALLAAKILGNQMQRF